MNHIELHSTFSSQAATLPCLLPQFASVCITLSLAIFGMTGGHSSPYRFGAEFGHWPSGTSSWNIAQRLQATRSDEFRKFDYENSSQNQQAYNSTLPPLYNLDQVTSRHLAVWFTDDDTRAPAQNINLWRSRIKVRLLYFHEITNVQFTHFDFLYGTDVGQLVYQNLFTYSYNKHNTVAYNGPSPKPKYVFESIFYAESKKVGPIGILGTDP